MAEHPHLHRGNVAVVIPALNEALRIDEVVDGLIDHEDLAPLAEEDNEAEAAATDVDLDALAEDEAEVDEEAAEDGERPRRSEVGDHQREREREERRSRIAPRANAAAGA